MDEWMTGCGMGNAWRAGVRGSEEWRMTGTTQRSGKIESVLKGERKSGVPPGRRDAFGARPDTGVSG